jgi:hypothetical protein
MKRQLFFGGLRTLRIVGICAAFIVLGMFLLGCDGCIQ